MIAKLINLEDIPTLKKFIEDNKSTKFRYFDKRGFDIIKNHIYSALYYDDDEIIGYGHLDYEGKTWLGIIISEKHRGKGYGKKIMLDLISNSKEDIYLTVDDDNLNALTLYKNMGLIIIKNNNGITLMKYKKNG